MENFQSVEFLESLPINTLRVLASSYHLGGVGKKKDLVDKLKKAFEITPNEEIVNIISLLVESKRIDVSVLRNSTQLTSGALPSPSSKWEQERHKYEWKPPRFDDILDIFGHSQQHNSNIVTASDNLCNQSSKETEECVCPAEIDPLSDSAKIKTITVKTTNPTIRIIHTSEDARTVDAGSARYGYGVCRYAGVSEEAGTVDGAVYDYGVSGYAGVS